MKKMIHTADMGWLWFFHTAQNGALAMHQVEHQHRKGAGQWRTANTTGRLDSR
jgi:hypothetical protein